MTRLNREYSRIQRSQIPHIVARPSDKSIFKWHFVLHSLADDTPYHGGEYHGMLAFPKEYPHQPPSILMMTPSGRFEVNTRLCLSMSDFHPETWNPSWGVETILVGLLSFMLDPKEPATTGGVHSSFEVRRKLAVESRAHNRENKEFCELFPEFAVPLGEPPSVGGAPEKTEKDPDGKPTAKVAGAGAAGPQERRGAEPADAPGAPGNRGSRDLIGILAVVALVVAIVYVPVSRWLR